MKHILFVDDEPAVLSGLRNSLRRHRKVWNMTFVSSGPEALATLQERSFDVIVTDMRMPGMDGATLLTHVKADHPGTVRIVLSGHAELEAALRAVPVAHQFLAKPCDPGTLEAVVERACRLQELVGDDQLHAIIGHIDRLPPAPRIYSRILEVLANPESTLQDLADLIEQDVSISAKLLQLVNSAFFAVGAPITDVASAVSRVGFDTVKNLTLASEVFAATPPPTHGFSSESFQAHCLLTARITRELMIHTDRRDDAFMVGLLHDIGKLLLVSEMPNQWEAAMTVSHADGIPFHEAEQQVHGVTHAEIGAYLLGLWGLPYPIVEAVGNHHAPHRVPSRELDLVVAVHVADALAWELVPPDVPSPRPATPRMDDACLEKLGLSEELEGWRERANTCAGSPEVTG